MISGRIFAIKRCEIHDGDGLRTTIFLKGCPLRCKWCHNPESLSALSQIACYEDKCVRCSTCVDVCKRSVHSITNKIKATDYSACNFCGECETLCPADAIKLWGRLITPSEAADLATRDKIFFDRTGGGVTLSGGEPLAQPEFCLGLLKELKSRGVNTALDTSLYAKREAVESVLPYVDTFLVDVKAFSPTVHERLTGKSNALIIENLRAIAGLGARIEFRVPLVMGLNDGEMQDIATLLSSINNVGVKVLPYHDYASDKYRALGLSPCNNARVPTKEELNEVREVFKSKRLRVIAD